MSLGDIHLSLYRNIIDAPTLTAVPYCTVMYSVTIDDHSGIRSMSLQNI